MGLYVHNNAGELLLSGMQQQARYKAMEGQAYGGMLQKLGSDIGSVMQTQGIKKKQLERDNAALDLLRTQFQMPEDEAKSLVKTVGADHVGQFMQAKQGYEINQKQLQAIDAQAQEQAGVIQTLRQLEDDGMFDRNPVLRSLGLMATNNIQVSPQQLQAAMNYQEGPRVGQAVPVEGGGARMVYDGKGFNMMKDDAAGNAGFSSQQEAQQALGGSGGQIYQDKQSGRWMINQSVQGERDPKSNLDQMVTVKTPVMQPGLRGGEYPDFEKGPTVRMTIKQAVEMGMQGYQEAHLEDYFKAVDQDKVMKVLEKLDKKTASPKEVQAELVKMFGGNESLLKGYLKSIGL